MVHQTPLFEMGMILTLALSIQIFRFSMIMAQAAWITLINPPIDLKTAQELLHGRQ